MPVLTKTAEPLAFTFTDDGSIPNNPLLPFLVYRGAIDLSGTPDPEQVVEKLLFEHELFDHQRYIAQMSVGAVAHADVMRSIELFGTQVAPLVREEVAKRDRAAA